MNTTTALTEEQVQEFQTVLGEIKGGWANVKDLPATFKTIQDETAQLGQQMKDVRRLVASRLATAVRTSRPLASCTWPNGSTVAEIPEFAARAIPARVSIARITR